jgi:hypothetical protein
MRAAAQLDRRLFQGLQAGLRAMKRYLLTLSLMTVMAVWHWGWMPPNLHVAADGDVHANGDIEA